MIKKINFTFGLCLSLFSLVVSAQTSPNQQGTGSGSFTPSEEQMELFQRLSPQQQKALAEKYGMDVDSLGLESNKSTSKDKAPSSLMLPRSSRGKGDVGEEELMTREEFEQLQEEESEELKPFGYDLFAGQPTTFSPLTMAPVPSNYIVGPGDTLLVNLYGKDNEQYELLITREGKLEIPGMQPLSVSGMGYQEMKAFVTEKVAQQFIGVKASISFGELRSIQIYVLGEAYTPGSYTVSSLSTVTHALFVSGGIKETGSLRGVQLKRAGKLVAKVDLYDLLINGDNSKDTLLQSGDVIFIPSVGHRVSVDGAVNRPGIYELMPGESYADLLEISGGAASNAYLDKVSIYRNEHGFKQINNKNLADTQVLLQEAYPASEMIVPAVNERFGNAIQVIGEVSRAGNYQWYPGLTASVLIGSEASFFSERSDTNYGLILREAENKKAQVLQFNPTLVLAGEQADIELYKKDKLFIFSNGNQSQQLLSLDELFSKDAANELIKEKVEASIEEQFFWDLYKSVNEEKTAQMLPAETELPSIFELENDSFAELVEKFDIRKWNVNTRQYLLWLVYETILNRNEFGQRLPLIEVTGNVRFPGTYPLASEANLKAALDAAGGITDLAADTIKISREGKDGSVRQFDVSVTKASDFILNSKDKIAVFIKPQVNEYISVEIGGEVKFPGSYTVKRGEMLSELVAKAGGLTEYAHAEGAVFSRLSLKLKERKNLLALTDELRKQLAAKNLTRQVGLPTSNKIGTEQFTDMDSMETLLKNLTDTEAVGRMVINLPSLLTGTKKADVELQRGDLLVIPQRTDTVTVVGEVYLPTSHRYSELLTVDDYLQNSGGIKTLGDDNNVYVVKANGAVVKPGANFWYSDSKTSLHPGDTIVVPLDAAPVDSLTFWGAATQIFYQSAIGLAAINNFSNN